MDFRGFRSWDHDLRAARLETLLAAAGRADAVVREKGAEFLITGSAARGEVHPWSDLDLIVRLPAGTERPRGLWEVEDATGLGTDVTVLMEDDVIPPLQAGMIGGARPLALVARHLAPLPSPTIAEQRVATALTIVVAAIEKDRAIAREIDDTADSSSSRLGNRWLWQSARRAGYRAEISLKRLAVFHDAGRSAWLDDTSDQVALRELIDRLSLPAQEPFERPAMLPERIGVDLADLVSLGQHWEDTAFKEEDAPRLLAAIEEWAAFVNPEPSVSSDLL